MRASNRRLACGYIGNRLRDQQVTGAVSPMHLVSMAPFVRCHTKAPPPLEEYERWFAANPPGKRAHTAVTALKLRRAVIMRHGGQDWSDIKRAVGMDMRNWLAKLPAELS